MNHSQTELPKLYDEALRVNRFCGIWGIGLADYMRYLHPVASGRPNPTLPITDPRQRHVLLNLKADQWPSGEPIRPKF